MKILPILFMLTLLLSSNLPEQMIKNDIPPEKYFDFWIGNWELTWETTNGNASGENIIIKILDDNVIEENFSVIYDPNMTGFLGKSWTVYNKNNGSWHQTWVDNQGSYLEFNFVLEGRKRIFKREIIKLDGKKVFQRMVFHNISENSFIWDWESSTDERNWKLLWQIKYTRKGTTQ